MSEAGAAKKSIYGFKFLIEAIVKTKVWYITITEYSYTVSFVRHKDFFFFLLSAHQTYKSDIRFLFSHPGAGQLDSRLIDCAEQEKRRAVAMGMRRGAFSPFFFFFFSEDQ